MQNCKIVKRASKPASAPPKVVNTCKLGKTINVKVQLISSPKREKSKSIPPKTTPSSTIASSCYSEDHCKAPVKVYVSLSVGPVAKPDDFIEPLADLTIPSTAVYLQHRNLSEPVPAIVDHINELKPYVKRLSKNPTILSKSVQNSSVKSLGTKLVSQSLNTKYYKLVAKTPSRTILRKLK